MLLLNSTQSINASLAQQAFKLTALLSAGCLATLGLFTLMSKLIEQTGSYQAEPSATTLVTIASVKEDTKVNQLVKPLPKPPMVKPMPRPVVQPTDDASAGQLIAPDGLDFTHKPTFNNEFITSSARNINALPIVRVPPKYPSKAAAAGIEGWVQLSFSINPIGQVVDVRVVDAEPKRLFDKEAKRALKKWKYKPKVVDGEAVEQTNQSVVLEFTLDHTGA